MNLHLTPEQQQLRSDVRAFLHRHCPSPEDVPHGLDERMAFLRDWQRRCYEAGYVGRAWPAEFGGGGRPPVEQIIVDEELAAAGAPEFPNIVGLDVIGPSLLAFGTDEQRARYVGPILSAEEVWCQGFSEPEAGSDLASLRARAVERDDEFVVSGQKTWTSWGQFARWCGVLARTEGPETRHKGISFLIVDMEAPGVEVRPMTQITGHAEFSELFLDEVVVPQANLLGARGQGWQIALHTLAHERGTAALPRQVKLRTWVDRLAADARERTIDGRPIGDREDVQVAIARALIGVEVLRHHASRTVGAFLNGEPVGPASSSVKLVMADAEQRVAATALDVLGESLYAPEPEPRAGAANADWYETYLFSRTATVLGGTQQIQRNIIADRILRLPQE
jgi:alkylation response protein AidB-like acyl-CoA dehydrogenase